MLLYFKFYDVGNINLNWSASNIRDPTYLGQFESGGFIEKECLVFKMGNVELYQNESFRLVPGRVDLLSVF